MQEVKFQYDHSGIREELMERMEKAVQEELEVNGYGMPEAFLQERDGVVENDVSGFFLRHSELPGKWVLVKMSETEQIEVQFVREGFLWQAVRCQPQEMAGK